MKKYGIASEKELIKVIDGRLHQRYLEAMSAGQTVTRKQLQNWGKEIRQDILTRHGKIKCIVSNKWMRRFLQRWNIQLADETTTTILPGTKVVVAPKVPAKSPKEVKDKLKRVKKSKDSSKVLPSPLPTVNLSMVPPPPPGLGTPFSGPVSMTLDINSEGSEFSAWDPHPGFDSPLTMPLLSEQMLDHQCLTAEQLTPPAEDEMTLKTEESDHQYWTMLNLPEPEHMQVEEMMTAPKMESLLSPASFASSMDEKPAPTPSTPPPKTTVSTPESKEAAAKLSSAILSSQSAAVQKLLLKNFDSLKAVLENMDIDPTVEYAIIMNESQVLNVMPITAEVREILAQDALYQASIKEGTANSQKQ